jgi:alpha-ketoglutarate-dependent taurine dioxygenase
MFSATISNCVVDSSSSTAEHLKELVDQTGTALFRAESREEFVHLCTHIGPSISHRDAGQDNVTEVQFDSRHAGRPGYDGLTSGPLDPHTDGSGNKIAPRYVSLWCAEQAGRGGESLLVDIEEVVSDLEREASWVVDTLSANVAIFRSGADEYCGPVLFRDAISQHWRVRLRLDSQGFFNGEGQRAITRLREAISRRTKTFSMQAGEGYIIDNFRVLHGRLPFSGSRKMLRILMG